MFSFEGMWKILEIEMVNVIESGLWSLSSCSHRTWKMGVFTICSQSKFEWKIDSVNFSESSFA